MRQRGAEVKRFLAVALHAVHILLPLLLLILLLLLIHNLQKEFREFCVCTLTAAAWLIISP